MVTSKELLYKIKKIIDKHYNKLTLSVLGNSVFTEEELAQMKSMGIDVSNPESFLTMVYNHNFINKHNAVNIPTSVSDMKNQQANPAILPVGEAHDYAVEHLNENAKETLDKLKQDVITRVSGLIRDNNQQYKNNALQNLTRTDAADELVKETTLAKVKQELRDMSGDFNRNWERIVVTETSNAIGLGSTDRIITENKDKPAEEIYTYKIVVQDAALCKFCKRFYLDDDGTPKVYRLSELLNNGSNYGKKSADWKPNILVIHPNCRESQLIELRPGWKVLAGGTQEFIGLEKWKEYILNKVQ